MFSVNGKTFVIGNDKDEKYYLFKIENMFGNGELSRENASLFPLLVGQGLKFKYLSDDKIIMQVLYCEGYDSDCNVEIYKVYEYNNKTIVDSEISRHHLLTWEDVEYIVPFLFQYGETVENGKELWKSAYSTRDELVRSRTQG